MSKPYLYPQHCPVCGSRMDPNADNLKAGDGEEVCGKECQEEANQEPMPKSVMDAAFPLLAATNDMLRRISIGPKP